MLTEQELREIEERRNLREADKAPWTVYRSTRRGAYWYHIKNRKGDYIASQVLFESTANFIAHSPDDVDRLLEEVHRQREELDAAHRLLDRGNYPTGTLVQRITAMAQHAAHAQGELLERYRWRKVGEEVPATEGFYQACIVNDENEDKRQRGVYFYYMKPWPDQESPKPYWSGVGDGERITHWAHRPPMPEEE